uniref:Uncharacterized protein n=1 Tax=Arion vulgaris TaxID=1028688 RepID=A0A0B7B4A9_9EUPU
MTMMCVQVALERKTDPEDSQLIVELAYNSYAKMKCKMVLNLLTTALKMKCKKAQTGHWVFRGLCTYE